MIQGRLWVKVLLGLFFGTFVGVLLGPTVGFVSGSVAHSITSWLAFPGQLFLALIKMIVIPLVFASIVKGLTGGGSLDQVKRLGFWALLYFIGSTSVAILIGMTLAEWIQPGQYIDPALLKSVVGGVDVSSQAANTEFNIAAIPQQIIGLLPSNPLNSMVQSEMIQVVIFAMVMGVALMMIPVQQAKPMQDLLGSLQEVSMTVVKWAMKLAPWAVFGLSTQITSKVGFQAIVGLGVYVGTVVGGLFLLLLFYLMIVWIFTRRSPLSFLSESKDLALLAFSTSSSAAVMPMTIKVAEERFKVKSSTSQFIIPLGATVNMDGTALYQGVAALFLAQVFGLSIGFESKVIIVLTSVGASIGSPATPGVGIAILSMVLSSAGIPPIGVALIMGVDRILDMCRTAVNVLGDLTATLVLDRLSNKESKEN
tara:strand:- start:1658 stop:2929 length:1272 start_codon:yes stop_codon:yes gene_type:complete